MKPTSSSEEANMLPVVVTFTIFIALFSGSEKIISSYIQMDFVLM